MPHVLYIQSADFCCFLIHSPGYGSKLLIPAGWLNILNNLHLDNIFLDPHLVWKNSHFQQPNRFKCLVADRPSLRWRFPALVCSFTGSMWHMEKNEVSFGFATTLDDFSWFLEDCLFAWFDLFLRRKWQKNMHQMNPNDAIMIHHDFVGWLDVFRRSNRNHLNSNGWFKKFQYVLIIFIP